MPFSVTMNVVGLQTDDAGHVDQNSSAHVARVVGLKTDAVVVTETRFKYALAAVVREPTLWFVTERGLNAKKNSSDLRLVLWWPLIIHGIVPCCAWVGLETCLEMYSKLSGNFFGGFKMFSNK